MKEVKAILLEECDVKDEENVMKSLYESANNACLNAGIVIFRGRIVKNRYGMIANTSNVKISGDFRFHNSLKTNNYAKARI